MITKTEEYFSLSPRLKVRATEYTCITKEQYGAFHDRVTAIFEIIGGSRRGLVADLSRYTNCSPSRISNVLQCKLYDILMLERIEEWVHLNYGNPD